MEYQMGKMDGDLINLSQMFLVPATILFVAMAIAATEGVKTWVSFLSILLGGIWVFRVYNWVGLPFEDWWTGIVLASTFAVASILSFLFHGYSLIVEKF